MGLMLILGVSGLVILIAAIMWGVLGESEMGGLLLIIAIVVGGCWYSAGKQAALLNATYKTNYTASDLFWSGEVVMKRIEGLKLRITDER